MTDMREEDRPTLQRPPLPSIPDFKSSESKNRYAGRETLSRMVYPAYSPSDTGIMSMKESTYSTEDINDMIHNLHCQVETLKDKLHPSGSTGKASSLYENIDRSTVRHHLPPCSLRLMGSANDAGFHRFKLLFDPNVGACRRFLWTLLLAGALALLVFQLIDRTHLFISQPTSVTIETRYFDSIAFPAVTICNRNMFRLTKLVDAGMFKEVYNLYNTEFAPDSLRFAPKAIKMDTHTREFLRNISHRGSDLIRGCQWRDMACGAHNFTETLTDYGLCYTFSPTPTHTTVHGSGPGDGLFVELNVEQYDYLLGGRSAVGARVAVHERGHVPRMAERGIDVSVGAHTSLEFDITKNSRLSSTTRQCMTSPGTRMSYDREECLSECEAARLVRVCGCRPPFLDYMGEEAVTCEKLQYLRCMLEGKDSANTRINCSCPIQCHSVDYEGSVSHAAMSSYAADSTVRRLFDRSRLSSSLEKSRDTYHRIDKAIFGYDVLRLTSTVDALKKVTLGISAYVDKTKNHDIRYNDSIQHLHSALVKLNTTVATDYPNFDKMTHISFYPLVQQISQRLQNILDHEVLMKQLGTSMTTYVREQYVIMIRESNDVLMKFDVEKTLLPELRKGVETFRSDMMTRLGKQYREFDVRRYEYNNSMSGVIVTLDKMSNEIHRIYTYVHATYLDISSQTTEGLGTTLKTMFTDVTLITDSLEPLEKVLDNVIKSYIEARGDITKFAKKLFKTIKEFTPTVVTISESRASLRPTLLDLQSNGRTLSRKFDSLGQEYEKGKMRKSELASTVNGDTIKSLVKQLKWSLNATQVMIGSLLEASSALTASIKPMTSRLIEFDVITSSQLGDIHRSVQFEELLDDVYLLTRSTGETLDDVQGYQGELWDYNMGNRVNGRFYLQNFLQLEVYFRDLRETVVTQQRAYGLFDFTCDIGGTLALYMGISALTLVEFVDVVLTGLFCARQNVYTATL